MRTARDSSRPYRGLRGLPQCMLGYTHPPTPRCGPGDLSLGVGLEIPPGCGPGDPPPPETCCTACWDTTCKACWDTRMPISAIFENITLCYCKDNRNKYGDTNMALKLSTESKRIPLKSKTLSTLSAARTMVFPARSLLTTTQVR